MDKLFIFSQIIRHHDYVIFAISLILRNFFILTSEISSINKRNKKFSWNMEDVEIEDRIDQYYVTIYTQD